MRPTELLKEEHHGVKLALRILDRLANLLAGRPETKDATYAADLAKLLAFFRIFVDKCHHAKEEEVLFPALLAAGLPRAGGPVQVMLAEHDAGRKLVADMYAALASYQAGSPGATAAFAVAANGYAQLLADHIAKEDDVLYPIADVRLSEPVQAGMIEAFESIETERIGLGTHEQFHAMLKEFKSAYLN